MMLSEQEFIQLTQRTTECLLSTCLNSNVDGRFDS